MADCCKIAGYFPTEQDRLISVDSKSGTSVVEIGGILHEGSTQGVATVTAYASFDFYVGCAGSAQVNIPWMTRYDCDNDQVHFIFKGAGQSSIIGDVDTSLVRIPANNEVISYRHVKASSASGPFSLYNDDLQRDGYGLIYNGPPWAFNTTIESSCVIQGNTIYQPAGETLEWGPLYIHSFSINFNPGELPVATYGFVFTIA